MTAKQFKIALFCLCFAFLQAACAGAASDRSSGPEVAPRVGSLAPDFSLQTPDGSAFRLSDLRGSAVFVNFWATNCQYCRYEMPGIQRMHDKYSAQGLVVLGVNTEDSGSDVQVYTERLKLTYPMLLDSDGKVAEAYLIKGLPYSYFIDKDGLIRSIINSL